MKYPEWICYDCGYAAQPNKRLIFTVSTYHEGKCGVCEQLKPITELRDFGRPTLEQLQGVKKARERLQDEAENHSTK